MKKELKPLEERVWINPWEIHTKGKETLEKEKQEKFELNKQILEQKVENHFPFMKEFQYIKDCGLDMDAYVHYSMEDLETFLQMYPVSGRQFLEKIFKDDPDFTY